MTNLIKETIEWLDDLGYEESDVLWVGSRDGEFAMSFNKFEWGEELISFSPFWLNFS